MAGSPEGVVQIARCGCSGTTCSCFLEAGAGIEISGSGSPGAPYVISVDSGSITVQDTPTINMSITGSGTGGDPYIIFGSVKLDPSVDNVLDATVNGLILTCDTIADCVGGVGVTTINDTSTINLTLTGAGTTLSPYLITATVKLSATAGNLLTANATGIYLSCTQVRGCLSAGDGLNYNSTTGVLEADISGDVGNTLVFGTDDGLYVPPGSGVIVDCGLGGLGTLVDPVVVDTGGSAWPYSCDDTEGAAVYCGDDGALRVDPEKFTVFYQLALSHGTGQANTFGATVGGGPVDVGGPTTVVVTNPSNCRDMTLIVDVGLAHALYVLNSASPNEIIIGAHFTSIGDIVADHDQVGHQRWRFGGGPSISFDSQRASQRFVYTLPAGGAATFSLEGSLELVAYNSSASINTWQSFLDIFGFSI